MGGGRAEFHLGIHGGLLTRPTGPAFLAELCKCLLASRANILLSRIKASSFVLRLFLFSMFSTHCLCYFVVSPNIIDSKCLLNSISQRARWGDEMTRICSRVSGATWCLPTSIFHFVLIQALRCCARGWELIIHATSRLQCLMGQEPKAIAVV